MFLMINYAISGAKLYEVKYNELILVRNFPASVVGMRPLLHLSITLNNSYFILI